MTIDTAAIRALEAQATPKPWSIYPTTRMLMGQDGEHIIHRNRIHCDSDAALIVTLRNQCIAMCDELDALKAENKRLRAVIQRFQDCSYREEHAAKVALFEALESKS